MPIKVSELNFYPIKSCGGTTLNTAEVGLRGIKNDREWMVVDEMNHHITQREIAKMCLVNPTVTHDGSALTLNAPGMVTLVVPITNSAGQRRVTVWSKACRADDQGDEVANWLSMYLDVNCRLVRMADDFKRQVDQRYAKRKTDQTGFADDFPLLLISEESLTDLNQRLDSPIPMDRFRPNIVVKGCGPFDEDKWKTVEIGGIKFDVVKPCARCVITTVDQSNGATSAEPLKTLGKYRNSRNRLLFGQNIIHHSAGNITVGDELTVID